MAGNVSLNCIVKIPLWVHIYLAWLVRLKRAGFKVDAERAGRFVVRHIKVQAR
jgi:hypothetical protein